MIDIIIPVYNTPLNDLERCFNSVLSQTFKDYNVYIIDDGSNINTREYLDDYIKDKSNFIVKHIKNNGVSNARNVGLNLSSSKYIAFVDSDDTLEKYFLEDAYKLIIDNELDVIIGGYNEIKDNVITRTRVSMTGLHVYEGKSIINFQEKLLSSKTSDCNIEIGDCPVGRIYTRLFKRSSIGNLRFDSNVCMSEDTLFMIDYSYKAKRIGIIDKVWYNYYKNDYSISNDKDENRLINNIKGFISEIEKRMNVEKNSHLKNAYQLRIDKAKSSIYKITSL